LKREEEIAALREEQTVEEEKVEKVK